MLSLLNVCGLRASDPVTIVRKTLNLDFYRKKWACNYSHPRPNTHSIDVKKPYNDGVQGSNSHAVSGYWSGLRTAESVTDPELRSQECDFPAVFFLDSDVFQRGRIEIPRPSNVPIPSPIMEFIGNIDDIRSVAVQYFQTIHTWMPFISKKRLYEHLLNPLSRPRADHFLLLFCMKLIMWSPLGNVGPKTPEYVTAKRFQLELEIAELFTVQGLQAGLLISLYEIGHGIYPSAYTSIGSCARLAIALGIDRRNETFEFNERMDWVEREERTRIWWTIVIIDQCGSLSFPDSQSPFN